MPPKRLPPCANARRRTPFPILAPLRGIPLPEGQSRRAPKNGAARTYRRPENIHLVSRAQLSHQSAPRGHNTVYPRLFYTPGAATLFSTRLADQARQVSRPSWKAATHCCQTCLPPPSILLEITQRRAIQVLSLPLSLLSRKRSRQRSIIYRAYGSDRMVEYTTWSDVYSCPACRNQIVYWDVVQRAKGTTAYHLACPSCRHPELRKVSLEWARRGAGREPHLGGQQSDRHALDNPRGESPHRVAQDVAPIPYWTPTVSFGPEREMWRAAHHAHVYR